MKNTTSIPAIFLPVGGGEEANQANHVKYDTPVMVVMGNSSYSISSSNKSERLEELMDDYKKDLNERNIQSLSDGYRGLYI